MASSISYIRVRDADGNPMGVECFLSDSGNYGQIVRRRMADTWVPTTPVTVTTGGNQLLAANIDRMKYVLYNNGSVTIFIGNASVTAANGIPLPPGQWWIDEIYSGVVYGITLSGSGEMRIGELTND